MLRSLSGLLVTQPSITCPRCGKTSYNPNDIAQGYCGGSGCHWWTSDPVLGAPEVIAQAEADGAIQPLDERRN